MEGIELDLGDVDRLDVHFGVGAELQVVGVASSGGGPCQAALVNWSSTSHPLRQVTVEAGPSLRKLHAAPHRVCGLRAKRLARSGKSNIGGVEQRYSRHPRAGS